MNINQWGNDNPEINLSVSKRGKWTFWVLKAGINLKLVKKISYTVIMSSDKNRIFYILPELQIVMNLQSHNKNRKELKIVQFP